MIGITKYVRVREEIYSIRAKKVIFVVNVAKKNFIDCLNEEY